MKSPARFRYGFAGAAILSLVRPIVLHAQDTTRLDIRWSPIIDLHFHARALADSSKAPPTDLAPLMEPIRKLDKALGGWGPLEANLYGCNTAAEVRAVFSDLPERFTPRGPGSRDTGKEVEFRALALALADGLVQVEPSMARTMASHEGLVKRAREAATERLARSEAACLKYMIDHLGPQDRKTVIPVYLVADMPFPGAVTHYRAGRAGGVCFVAVRDVDPLQLVESILHEATHALDIAWDGSGVLDELRKKLQESAPPVGRNVLHNVPHTLMFVHAAETVRRNIDPTHKHYGDVAGYYAKVPRATGAVRQPWIEYLDGKLSREDALDHMVQSVSSPTGPQ